MRPDLLMVNDDRPGNPRRTSISGTFNASSPVHRLAIILTSHLPSPINMRLRHLAASSALGATLALAAPPDTFHESLTLQPLPDGKLSVQFEFTTHFSLHTSPGRTREASTGSKLTEAQSHHSLTSPSLLLPLEHNNVSELTVSFTSGQWHAHRHGEAGPLAYEAGGAGADVRGWLEAGSGKSAEAWDAVTSAFGGLFCAGVGADDMGEVVTTYGALYPPARQGDSECS